MWEQDWSVLGIAPTTELAAIKKAYALKLRVTRPDDDAEAYQALRAAYERAQQWARLDEAPVTEPVANVSSTISTPNAQAAVVTPPTDPVALIDAAETMWNEQGHDAFVAHWPLLREQLDALPLSAAAPAARAFAEWTLRHRTMPDAMLANFETYFGWRDDFRSAQQLGSELAQALHGLLDDIRPRLLNDPELLSQAAPLLQLDALNARPATRWKAWAIGTASAQTLSRLKAGMGEHLLTRLGLQPTAQRSLDFLLLTGLTLRWIPLLLVITATLMWTSADLQSASMVAVGVALSVMAWRGVSGLLGACLRDGLQVLDRVGRDDAPPQAPQADRTGIGLGLFAASALLGALGSDWPWHAGQVLGFLCITAGLFVGRWTLSADRSRVLAASLIAAVLVFHGLLGKLLAPATWAGLACLWACMSSLGYEERLRAGLIRPLGILGRPISNALAVGDRWGSSLACWVPLLAGLAGFELDGPRYVVALWGSWSLASFLLAKTQAAIDDAALRCLSRDAERG